MTPPASDTAPEARALQPLGEYEWPAMPVEEALHRAVARFTALFSQEDKDPFIAEDELERTTLDMLDSVVAPPACGPILEDVERSVAAWRAEPLADHLKVIVIPPCDESDILSVFAEQHGLDVLAPPSREALLSDYAATVPPLEGAGVLVIPQLERWFLRHRNGLGAVRALLAALYEGDRRCLIGCNSWAWAYLARAIDADMLLPGAVTFQPFGAERLEAWFSGLARADASRDIAFRFSASGEDVFNGETDSEYFQTLAAHSLGIPWVAWHLWRRSLFQGRDADGEAPEADAPEADAPEADAPEAEDVLWVGDFDRVILPGKHPQTALLVLHALLIHGPLTPAEVRATVPVVGEPNIVPAILAAGFAEHVGEGGAVRCRASAYPAIRSGLQDAGFPVDTL